MGLDRQEPVEPELFGVPREADQALNGYRTVT